MSTCNSCKRDMLSTDGCEIVPVRVNGIDHLPIPFGKETRYGDVPKIVAMAMDSQERCPDCNVKKGQYHHPGCDVEECPACHRQILGCDCQTEKSNVIQFKGASA